MSFRSPNLWLQSMNWLRRQLYRAFMLFLTFFPDSLSHKLKSFINSVLTQREKPLTTVNELRRIIFTRVLATSYYSNVSKVLSRAKCEYLYITGLLVQRYSEIWSSFSVTRRKRQRTEKYGIWWSNTHVLETQLIAELDIELAAINQTLVYIPDATMFSLDDDHQRLRYRSM